MAGRVLRMTSWRFVCALLLCALALAAPARRTAYPSKPVRVIVPFAPGGPADLIARLVAQKLSEDFGKQFYVENHAGAGGNIGAGHRRARARRRLHAHASPARPSSSTRSLYKSLPYDPDKDFVAVTRIATTPNVLVVHPSVPAKTMKELVELIKREPANTRLCAARRRHAGAPVRRTVQAVAETRPAVDPVRRRRADDPVGGRRPHADRVLLAAAGGGADPGRHVARARGHRARSASTACRTSRPWPRPAIPGQIGETPVGIWCRPARRRRSSSLCTARS